LIFSVMRLRDRKALGAACSWFKQAIEEFHGQSRTISFLLGPFFSTEEIVMFQTLQALTGLLISGSTALQFFSCNRFHSDLDTYCTVKHCFEVGQWLIKRGYQFVPTEHQSATFSEEYGTILKATRTLSLESDIEVYDDKKIAGVWTFSRHGSVIQLIGSIHAPLEVILSFHSTCVMNIITHNAAYSLFPSLTFNESVTLMTNRPHPLTEKQRDALTKYKNRGFDLIDSIQPQVSGNPESALTFLVPRHVGDKHCWKI
ncbi:hypothetical protein BDP27DRAFT_1189021, partial [Rhodocollybia butyracea]